MLPKNVYFPQLRSEEFIISMADLFLVYLSIFDSKPNHKIRCGRYICNSGIYQKSASDFDLNSYRDFRRNSTLTVLLK